ncbi:MAG: hypothetical protein HC912_07105 [Saprospiraceae bacterium]|nr:hypothetical protein [Saprospiraceae bacterium]
MVWVNDDNYIKVVVVNSGGNNGSTRNFEMRREVNGVSLNNNTQYVIPSNGVSFPAGASVTLSLDINPANNEVRGYYSINGATRVLIGTFTGTFHAGLINGASVDGQSVSFAGIMATKRGENTATVNYSFEDFSIQEVNNPPTFTASTLTAFSDFQAGTKIGKVNATDPEGQPLTYSINPSNTAFSINSDGEISVNNGFASASSYDLNIEVSDGVNPAVSGTVTVNVKTVVSLTSPLDIKINFQDASDNLLPVGYLKDFGEGFDVRTAANQGSSTLTYGWIGVNTTYPQQPADLTVQGRNRTSSGLDPKIATFIHMQHPTTAPTGYWEMAVPNGQYLVTVSVGEANSSSGADAETHRINAEGVNIINNFQPTGLDNSLTRFTSGAKVVTVSDGRLTIDYAGGGKNTKINYVEVVSYTNQAPVLVNAIPNQVGNINTLFTYTFPANTFTDVEALTYTASLANNDPLPTWLTFDANTRTFSGTPTESANYIIKVSASDGTFSTNDEFDLVIEGVVNNNPVVSNANTTFNIFENATSVGQVLASDVDAGQILTYALTAGTPFAIDANGNITVSGTLDYGTIPSYTLTVTVSDDGTPQNRQRPIIR